MPINVTCSTCNQTVAAPESMAGKKAVCPNCKGIIAIPEQFAPAKVVEPETGAEPPSEHPRPASLDLTQPPTIDTQAAEEAAALAWLRLAYVFIRDDWRRLPTSGHLWLAFLLFFFPWINISCNGRTLGSQTGLQTCHGGWTVEPRFERLARNNRPIDNLPRPNLDDTPSWSLLSIVYVLFVFLGGFIGFAAVCCVLLRLKTLAAAAHLLTLALGSAACLALASQMMIGFPIEKHVRQQLDKLKTEHDRRNAMRPAANDPFDLIDVEPHYTGWLWWSAVLTFVSGPVFVLEFAILIVAAVRKHMQRRGNSG
jgi:hypothetical protein